MRRLGVQGIIFFQLGEPPILHDAIVDCRIPFFRAVRTRCLVPSCECGSRFCRRWQVPDCSVGYIFTAEDLSDTPDRILLKFFFAEISWLTRLPQFLMKIKIIAKIAHVFKIDEEL
ncbi:unnamed protein product [Trichogramma brassicae]|uniref:Uncharacterized protein n=1 Tax=Trichogramma brassicae TaxID=86971 RepID=A0A6H5ITE0_9HYME|nr:unnamed protein product [Trichogramma brassicae]